PDVVKADALKPFPASRTVAMAKSSISTPVKSACITRQTHNVVRRIFDVEKCESLVFFGVLW
ncbi:MAG: hypothetical protein AAGK05_11180, partial [Pseudomonadota bacterium]